MYTKYYGLTKKPFENTANPDFLYLSENHREVLASLTYGVKSAKGLILTMGDVGTGKTTLINALQKQLDPSFVIVRITNPRFVFGRSTFANILEYFAGKLGLLSNATDNRDLIGAVIDKLEILHRNGRRAVLIIDEAHLLSEESLHDIRLLSNIENEKTKLIQILLIGQNELNNKLQEDSLKALKQRFNITRRLMPLDKSETTDYIMHRLRVAGGDTQIFRKKALTLIFKKSSGVPRLINLICDNAMLIGYAVEARSIGGRILKEVIGDMESVHKTKPYGPNLFLRRIKWIGLAAVAFLLTVYLAMNFIHWKRFSSEIPAVKKDSLQIQKEIVSPPTGPLDKQTRYSLENASPSVETEISSKQREVNPVADETGEPPVDRVEASGKDRFSGKNESVVPEKQGVAGREGGIHGESQTGAEESNGTRLLQKPLHSQELPAGVPQPSGGQPAAANHQSPGLGKQTIISGQRNITGESNAGAGEKRGISPSHEELNPDGKPLHKIVYRPEDIKKSNLENRKKVMPNECLYELARREYGIGNESIVDLILIANPRIRDVNKIYPGQEITLPHIERKDLIVKDEKGLYYIHYASFFYNGEIAERCAQSLIEKHQAAFVIPFKQGEDLVYRVYLGPFRNRDDAEKVLGKIELKYFSFLSKDQNKTKHADNAN